MKSLAILLGAVTVFAAFAATAAERPASHSKPKELCVCGWNERTECDVGGYRHIISDCFDENNTPCAYDDQVSGRCDSLNTPRRKRARRLPTAWKLCTPLNFVSMSKCAVVQASTCAFRDGGSYDTKAQACDAANEDPNEAYCVNGTIGCGTRSRSK
jgi:hypothetical protein